MRAMVLCAGLGTRLRPLTEWWPKPALPLFGEPLLEYTLASLAQLEVTLVCINTHHLPDVMNATAATACARRGLSLATVHEQEIQGTGGGIRGHRARLSDAPFLVVNGDVLLAADLRALVSAHLDSGADATMLLMPMPVNERYASVDVDVAGRVRRIAGAGGGLDPQGPALTPLHFTGVHVMNPTVFDFMRSAGPEDINREVYVRMLGAGRHIHAHVAAPTVVWSDLGTPARYLGGHAQVASQSFPWGAFPGLAPRGPRFIAGSAELEPSAVLEDWCALGPRVRVGAGARLARVVALEGASIPAWAELRDCVVLPDSKVLERQA